MLSLDSVSFRSGDRVLLDAVSFSLAPGQFYGVIGHNGAGKSTLIRLLGGELLPSSGAVLLDGAAVHAFLAKARARRIASLPQKLPDAADFLVRELVMLGRFPWQGWLQRPSAEDEVLLLDEPLAALDIVYQVEVLQLVRRLVAERGLTVVMIIHDINLAARFCDVLIALKAGRLCRFAPVGEVMSAAVLREVFGVDLHLLAHPDGKHRVAVV